MRSGNGWERRRAFTLVELLLVIVIIGVLTAIVAPQFSAGIAGTRLQVSARELARAERYARTMALLHQTEIELTIISNRVLRVDAVGAVGRDGALDDEGGRSLSELPTAPAGRAADSLAEPGDEPPPDDSCPAAATAAAFAAAVRVEHVFDRVVVRFLGYTDSEAETADGGGDAAEEDALVRIRFRSNGTCRPHRFRLEDLSGAALEMEIDILGTARIDEI